MEVGPDLGVVRGWGEAGVEREGEDGKWRDGCKELQSSSREELSAKYVPKP